MILEMIVVVLILLILFYQTLQGSFTATIMAGTCLVAGLLAFNYYEVLYDSFLINRMPDYGRGVALVAIFALSLIVLRELADHLIPGNFHLPLWVDRGVAAGMGLVSAQIIIGVLSIGVLWLPFEQKFLGYRRFAQPTGPVNHLSFLRPDGFVVGLVEAASARGLAGAKAFERVHPNLLAEVQISRNGVQRESRHAVPAAEVTEETQTPVLKVVAAWRPERRMPDDPVRLGLRLRMLPIARDEDNHYRFTPQQIRLVATTDPDGRVGSRQFYPVALAEPSDLTRPTDVKLTEPVVFKASNSPELLEVVFALPSEEYRPWFVEFKGNARADLTAIDLDKLAVRPPPAPLRRQDTAEVRRPQERPRPGPTPTPAPQPDPALEPDEPAQTDTPGKVRMVQLDAQGTGQTDLMPHYVLAPAASGTIGEDARVVDSRFASGRIAGPLGQSLPGSLQYMLDGSRPFKIERFVVPEGQAMWQVRYSPARLSTNILSHVRQQVDPLLQARCKDNTGREHFVVGYYAVVNRSGTLFMELFYDPTAPLGAGRTRFTQIEPRERMAPTTQIGLIFLAPRGVRMTTCQGGSANFAWKIEFGR